MSGLSTIGSISLGWALVAGRKRVPSPAAGNTALRTFIFMEIFGFQVLGRPSFTRRTIVSGAFDNWRPGELEPTPCAALANVFRLRRIALQMPLLRWPVALKLCAAIAGLRRQPSPSEQTSASRPA